MLIDLPPPVLTNLDVYSRFEKEQPFARTMIGAMMEKIAQAEEVCGNKGYVTIDSLSQYLTTMAWAPLKDRNS